MSAVDAGCAACSARPARDRAVQVSPLTGKQLESVRHATARLDIWEGSVRSSKTISSLIAWLKFVRNAPPGNLLMAGKTERTLKRNILDPLTEMLGDQRCRLVQARVSCSCSAAASTSPARTTNVRRSDSAASLSLAPTWMRFQLSRSRSGRCSCPPVCRGRPAVRHVEPGRPGALAEERLPRPASCTWIMTAT